MAMAQPGPQQRRLGLGALPLAAVLLLLLSLCLLARAGAAVAATVSAEANLERKEGAMMATAPEEEDAVVGQEAAAEGDRPERMEMETIDDYVPFGANNRHNPHP
ncbi:uncharacterized protein LOC107304866 [Oryza brachyantha]|uniref:Uncharacterized protein n=1 Tax=Oryza brachyantha TaxID=4533 RepID=J3KYJ2_ORYBR|nr:uncharacterized protein LOC107304866 [Oryza brachyantha]